MSERPEIAFVSREVAPFGGGGIGTYVTATAAALSEVADVRIFTTDLHRPAYERLRRDGDPLAASLAFEFIAEPHSWELGEADGFLSLWSARAFEALCAAYPGSGPDLVEFPDYLGEGFATAQARACDDPRIARTTVCVRAYTTGELTSVLDGHISDAWDDRVTHQIERYALANCDHFLWPGGDVLGTYHRYFGEDAVAAPVRVRHPLDRDGAPAPAPPPAADGELRLLYVGRLERRKGVLDLARAVSGIPDDRLRLTFLGGDTETAPLGGSMRALLELMIGGDPRVEFLDAVPRERLGALIEAHDVVVLPSLWECWPAVALEALERNRPVLATRTGGFAEIVEPGSSGWLVDAGADERLAEAIEGLLAERGQVAELTAAGRPRQRLAELADADEVRASYLELAAEVSSPPAVDERPLVSIVVPYYRLEEFVEATVRSVAAQTYEQLETVIVNDGSLRADDRIVGELADRYGATVITQVNSGLSAARNTGVLHSRGRYVMFLDADNMIAPTFIERCVEVLERHPEYAYVAAWSRYIDERGEPWPGSEDDYRPLGNWTELVHQRNVAGDAAAVFRRSVFEGGLEYGPGLTSFEDWALYRLMHEEGLVGTVIPERLLEYRIRDKSMLRQIGAPNQERIEGEIRAWIAEQRTRWRAP